ncbi:MAG: DNA translocase FtsK [Bacteroidales bacterium]|nr:DNA translocase FtsK [Bacteroidales bacterium]
MGKEKNTTAAKEKNAKGKGPKKPSRFLAFLRGEQTQFAAGLLVMLLSALLGIGFLSFIVTGKDDQAILENLSWYEIFLPNNDVHNWVGTFGAFTSEWCVNRWLGLPVLLFVGLLFRFGRGLISSGPMPRLLGAFVRTAFMVIWLSLLLSAMSYILDTLFGTELQSNFLYLGGKHGYELTQLLVTNLHVPGLVLFLIASGLIIATFMFDSTIEKTRTLFGLIPWLQGRIDKHKEEKAAREAERQAQLEAERISAEEVEPVGQQIVESEDERKEADDVKDPTTVIPDVDTLQDEVTKPMKKGDDTKDKADEKAGNDPVFVVKTGKTDTVKAPVAETTEDLPQTDYDPTADLSHYKFPTFDLLKTYPSHSPIDMDEQTANKEKIRQTLSDYGIEIQSISATVGPTITLFEIVLESGTKISRVKNLSDEIAMSIASKSGIRIIAPIPGKSAIGIEVPNNDPQTVSMRDCISSRAFQESKYELPIALGKTIMNEVFTFDLTKAPHLLVAGATGQGKSVGLNAIITSLLYKKHPSQLKIVLVDPKMVEFSIYKRIEKHYLAKLPDQENPIITDVTKTVDILKSLCAEMEDRYALVEDAGVRNIKEYNEKFIHRQLNPRKHISAPIGSREGTNHRYLPYIVAIIDEYGDLIMTAGKEVELPIARIAQKARAVGIHMIIATQRPSAKIVTGIIKANFPARMAFRVSSGIDSGIILDQPGAQNLIGRGDLLFSTGRAPERVQCAYVDTPEVDRICRFIAGQQGYPTALILPEPRIQEGDTPDGNGEVVDLHQLDPLFNECAELVVANAQGSTSMIQRKFQIGYNRAGRIMDQLEAAGIVGPYSGSKARAVLVTSDSELRSIIEDLGSR